MLRVVFMGTPDFAVPTLMEIAGQGHIVPAVYTQPPRPAGRGMETRKSAVHRAADALGLPVRHPATLKDEADALAALEPDVLVVVAYGLLLPGAILSVPAEGAFNVHASLLPRWRGAAPVARAIMAGDAETGVGIMKMDEGLDTGPVAMEERLPIGPDDTAGALTERLSRLGADLMARALGALQRGGLQLREQPTEGATYAKKIRKDEARIDFSEPAPAVRAKIHGLNPMPGAFTTVNGERLKILRVSVVDGAGAPGEVLGDGSRIACGEGAIALREVQRAGKSAMSVDAFLRGSPLMAGDVVG